MFPYANELTPFETDRFRELLQMARILNICDVYPVTSQGFDEIRSKS